MQQRCVRPLPPHVSSPTRRFRLPPLSSWWTGASCVELAITGAPSQNQERRFVSSCQSSCGSVSGPSFSPAAVPVHRGGARRTPGSDRTGRGRKRHTRGTRGVALPRPMSELASRQTPRLPPHIAAGDTSGSGTERRPRRTCGRSGLFSS